MSDQEGLDAMAEWIMLTAKLVEARRQRDALLVEVEILRVERDGLSELIDRLG